ASVDDGEVEQAAEHSALDVDVESLDEERAEALHLRGEQADEDLVDAVVLTAELLELAPVDRIRLGRLERRHRRRANRPLRDQSELADRVTGTPNGDQRGLAEGRPALDREASPGDQVQRVG